MAWDFMPPSNKERLVLFVLLKEIGRDGSGLRVPICERLLVGFPSVRRAALNAFL